MDMTIRTAWQTDKGMLRKNNEDNLLARPNLYDAGSSNRKGALPVGKEGALFAVADGMGGLQAGEVASSLAIEALEEMIDMRGIGEDTAEKELKGTLGLAFMNAHTSLLERAEEDPAAAGMGTTLVVGYVRDGWLHAAWLGDSRCYRYRKGSGLECLTKDHSYVQLLVDEGHISMEEAFDHPRSNIVTRSLICREDDDTMPDYASHRLEAGDRLLFCSDGLNGMLRDHEIEEILAKEADTDACVKKCVREANRKGGKDNITVVLVDVVSMEG